MRLSKDDGAGESSSIKTQRSMLKTYANKHHFLIYDEYIDDGFSGTNFDRPDFQRMIDDIEQKKINLVITKDLSRLGRDYIISGQYTEIYFPSKGIRYIAINDGYDSENQYTDIAPFKNVINEMYARDTSKKIRSAFITKMNLGKYIGNFAPFGYIKDPQNKNHLIIDPYAAPIVRQIFSCAENGKKPSEIASFLNGKQIPTPIMYRCMNHPYLNIDNYSKRKEWTSGTISKLLRNVTYIGNTAQRKTTKVSFKSKKVIKNSKDDWIIVENTHEPIISKETFDIVQRISKLRTCGKKDRFFNIFSGIAKCSDCKKNMSAVGTRKKDSSANLACGTYKAHGVKECSNHFIDYDVLYSIVLSSVKEQVQIPENEKKKLAYELEKAVQLKNSKTYSVKTDINKLKARLNQLDTMVEKLYEDNCEGIINDERFYKLLERYEAETKSINEKIKYYEKTMERQNNAKQAKKSCDDFIKIIEEYTSIDKLTPEILFKLIDRIEIEQGYYEKTEKGRIKHQTIKIFYRFTGTASLKEYIV